MTNKIVQFKATRRLHDSGYRILEIKDESGKIRSQGSDVIHLQLGGSMGSWISIDCQKDGTFRIFGNGIELELDEWASSDFFVKVKGKIRVGDE